MIDKTVLAYIDINDQYLLLYRNKKKEDINKGKWIGVGGHIEERETPEDALRREIKEETGYNVIDFQKRGILHFGYGDYQEIIYLYTVAKISGEMIDCDEGMLKFFDKKEVFDLPMWEGDKIFLKYLLNDEPYFELELIYEGDKLISYKRIK